MHTIIGRALAAFGTLPQAKTCAAESRRDGVLCFLHHTPGDLVVATNKIVGSAQRKQRGAMLQHGAVLLAQSRYTPALPGLRELAGLNLSTQVIQAVIQSAFAADTGFKLQETDWSAKQQARIDELVRDKYATDEWNLKR
jgi:lipoate-protein ligase A